MSQYEAFPERHVAYLLRLHTHEPPPNEDAWNSALPSCGLTLTDLHPMALSCRAGIFLGYSMAILGTAKRMYPHQ